MTARYDSEILSTRAEVVASPAQRACNDHSFEMPSGIYFAMAALFFGFISVLSFAFMGPTMVVPYAICVILLTAYFAVPAIFVRTGPQEARTKALDWAAFRESGLATATGRTPATEAVTLTLLLPGLVFLWAVAVATIAAAT